MASVPAPSVIPVRQSNSRSHVPSTFTDLGVPEAVSGPLAQRGITTAFPIQELAIPAALEGRDVCGRAPTGSGKTLAFGIPLALRVERAKPFHPKALVLAPTRELAQQIDGELQPLLAPSGRRTATFYGGVSFVPQMKNLRRGVDVAVGCPGRIADLVNQGNLHLDQVAFVVIDEADRMADMGFLPEVRRLLDLVRPDRQTLLFSATLDGDVDVLIRSYQNDPVRCEVQADERDGTRTEHRFERIAPDRRIDRTADLVTAHGPTVVFCRTKYGADRVAAQLGKAGVAAVAIHGGRSQAQRQTALDTFARGRAQALVATDVAARGIHVDDVGCVVHFDLPADPKDYVHRSGRTGRAGASGVVVSLVVDGVRGQARRLQEALALPVALVDAPAGSTPATPAAPKPAPVVAAAPAAANAGRPGPDRRPGRPGGAPAGRRHRTGGGGGTGPGGAAVGRPGSRQRRRERAEGRDR
jgi:superfamily II DNA/RNA helicase